MNLADLHLHSNTSDGSDTLEELIEIIQAEQINVFALTDHDNVLSYKVAKNYIDTMGINIQIIKGIEINTLYKDYEVHILGYFPDETNSDFISMLKMQQQARLKQAKEIIKLLAKKEGIRISLEDIKAMVAEGGSIGRPHIAKAITNAGGTNGVIEAYNKYIHKSSPVYVERKTVSPFDAVEVIYDSGGVPVIAHPYDIDIAAKLIKDLMNCGLRGIEAYHRKHSPAIVEYFSSMAEELGLIVTGGSDFHAPNIMNGQIILGKNFVPEWIWDKLHEEKKCLDLA